MAIKQGPGYDITEVRFAPKNRLRLTTEETEDIYKAAAPAGGTYQYFEMMSGGGANGIVYRFPAGTDFTALENFEDEHPELKATFLTNRPAPANAVYPVQVKPPRPKVNSSEIVSYLNVGTPAEKRVIVPQSAPIPHILNLPQHAGTPVQEEMRNPLEPTYGSEVPKTNEIIASVLDYTLQNFGEAPSLAEAKKRMKAFGSGAPYPEWHWKDKKHTAKVRNPFLTYLPKADPADRVNNVRTGALQATLVGKPAAEAAQRSGMGIWRLPKSYLGEYSGEENRYIVYRPGDTAKRDQVLKILEAYPVGYRGREYFQEMGAAMGIPETITTPFVDTFYTNPTTLPEGISAPKGETPKWLGLMVIAGLAVLVIASTKPKTTAS